MASAYRKSCTPLVIKKALVQMAPYTEDPQSVFSDLPFEVVSMIAEYYTEMQRADAASTLQAALQRHWVMQCDDPHHSGHVTYSRAPVACYVLTHAHPGCVACSSTRTAYFERHALGLPLVDQ